MAALVREIHLGPDDRVYSGVLTAPVKVKNAIHVAVVGDRHSGLTIGHSSSDRLVEPRGAVEHRILGVDVKVSERVRHALLPDACGHGCGHRVDKSHGCDFDHSGHNSP